MLCFAPQTHRERRGASQSSLSAIENVITCIDKDCLSGRHVVDAYSCDFIGTKTKLPHWKKLEGTGANEAAHRCIVWFIL